MGFATEGLILAELQAQRKIMQGMLDVMKAMNAQIAWQSGRLAQNDRAATNT